jgi:hypothetical protein
MRKEKKEGRKWGREEEKRGRKTQRDHKHAVFRH